jgi:hypothetical protein
VVSFRPTPAQAAGRGAYLGELCGLAITAVVLVLWSAGVASRLGVPGWLALICPVAGGPVLGVAFGLLFGRLEGADVDDLGIHPVPGPPGAYAPWHRIEDLRTERVGGRTLVAVCFDTGLVARLGAPYDGRLLAADPQFERKMFMLRNLWETHRSFTLYRRGAPGRGGSTSNGSTSGGSTPGGAPPGEAPRGERE